MASDHSLTALEPCIISIQEVTKRFPGVVALDRVSFDLRAGELHAICGENGAGKSTLMKILSGIITEFDGRVLIRGEPIRFRGTRDAQAAGVSIIHQELNLVEQLSAAANIFLGRELRRRSGLIDQRRMNAETRKLLDSLECDIDVQARAGSLRVGDQQLLEIAKALSLQTDILIMDEPTSALTEAEVARLDRVIARLRQRDVTILYISHKLGEVFRLADRITVLRDGKHVQTIDHNQTNRREITHLMVGREIEETDLSTPRQRGAAILDVKQLSLPWPDHARAWRLKDVSFQLHRGEILGIAGLMGAGRTELLECLFGAQTESMTGQILVDNRVVRFRSPRDARRAGMAMVTEDRKRLGLFPQRVIRENISICTLRQLGPAGLVRAKQERSVAAQVLSKFGIRSSGGDASIQSLSGGNQQKTILGRWLLTHPKVLLLDDPTRGIDVGAKAELYRVMDQLCGEGLGIILTSSELPELLAICDRILVLAEGRLTATLTREEATEQKIMEAATASRSGRDLATT